MVHGILFSMAFGSALWIAFQCGRVAEQNRLLRISDLQSKNRQVIKDETEKLWKEFTDKRKSRGF